MVCAGGTIYLLFIGFGLDNKKTVSVCQYASDGPGLGTILPQKPYMDSTIADYPISSVLTCLQFKLRSVINSNSIRIDFRSQPKHCS